jgi:putative effector of murein hydrolase
VKKILKPLFYGFLTFIVWTIAAFIGYSFTGSGDRPTLLGSIVALIIILPATIYLGKRFSDNKPTNALIYSASLALGVFALNLLITIPNGTTKIFLGNWAVYLTFLGVFIGNYLGASKTR